MINVIMKKRWVIPVLTVFLFLSCMGNAKMKTPALPDRVEEYWSLLVKQDFEKSYQFEVPEYRKEVSLVEYIQSFGTDVTWLGARIAKIAENGTEATVEMGIRYRWNSAVKMPENGVESYITEKWVLIDNVWYHMRYKRK